MIKQIEYFFRDEEHCDAGSTLTQPAIIEVSMVVKDPKLHIEAIKALVKDDATIQTVTTDTIRATYKGSTQDKLLELIEAGWTFAGQEAKEEMEA